MASLSYSFAVHSQKNCDISNRYPGVKELFPLTNCKKDIRSHLRTIKVGQTSLLTEKDLILARTGHFREDGANMTVCPAHRAELGIFGRPRRKCAHPLHGNRKGKPGRGASLAMSEEIMAKWNTLVPIGAAADAEDVSETAISPEPRVSGESGRLPETSLQINKPSTADDNSSDVFSSSSQESLTAGETSTEWQPTPQIQMKLHSLNNFLRQAGDGRVSPIRSQLSTDVNNISSPTARYYRRKGVQAVESVLDAIAPGQKRWLLQQVMEACSHTTTGPDINTLERTLLSRLVTPYNEASNWYTRQQILSVFVGDYSKTELLAFIPGLTKWRIDEARKHAFRTSPGHLIDPPVIHRCRLDPVKVDHFLEFISSPSFLQDVAYGTKNLKLSDGETIEIPNVVRTVVASRLVHLYQSYCAESGFSEPIGWSTLLNILKVKVNVNDLMSIKLLTVFDAY
ncbi:PREDICTED: uncharacterized protein LOC107336165 [Acropora digitifera]|uniref:uncharacterized protein LOC107336165 n=1 Tax=Acropora digitifera TaxID=70779 RepID=UPI00077A42A0|nr:PREDICTED: uncharacterized protein LOC107336165 [Acropora digitifera]